MSALIRIVITTAVMVTGSIGAELLGLVIWHR